MSAVGKIVGKAVGGVTNLLVGGKTTKDTAYTAMPESEKDRLSEIESQINSLFGEQGTLKNINEAQASEIQNLFTKNLKSFLTNNGQMTPEQIQQASDFVDKTFTQPTQQVVDQNLANYQAEAQARAASLGRNPNLDIATNQAIAGEGLRQNIGLQAERGARIQQASNDNYNRGLQGLNVGLQGSGFLNNLTQQAFQNKLGLLNARSELANFYQNERKVGQYGTSSGLLPNISSVVGAASNLGKQIGSFGSSGGGMLGGIGGGV